MERRKSISDEWYLEIRAPFYGAGSKIRKIENCIGQSSSPMHAPLST